MEKHEHTFSWGALIRIIISGVFVILCWKALAILPVVLISLVLAAACYPVVVAMKKKLKIPLILSIIMVLGVPIIPIVFLCVIFIPKIIVEIPNLLTSLNNIVGHLGFNSFFVNNFNITSYLQSSFNYTNATMSVTLTFFAIITTVFLTMFLMYDFDRLSVLFFDFVPEKEKKEVKDLIQEIALVSGKYIRGNLLISIICGVVVFVILTLLHVPFALPLAIFSAIMDLLPLVGQTIGAVPAVIIGFGVSPFTGLLVIVLHLIYQQIENNFISPLIYNKSLNLYPSVVFFSVLLGASLFGILGAFLALPIAASIPAVIQYHKKYKIRRDQ